MPEVMAADARSSSNGPPIQGLWPSALRWSLLVVDPASRARAAALWVIRQLCDDPNGNELDLQRAQRALSAIGVTGRLVAFSRDAVFRWITEGRGDRAAIITARGESGDCHVIVLAWRAGQVVALDAEGVEGCLETTGRLRVVLLYVENR